MTSKLRLAFIAAALCALLIVSSSASRAGTTFIKLDLGGVGPDIQMNAAGALSTVNDADAATAGDQDTAINYTGFLSPLFANVTPPPSASFTLSGLQAAPTGAQLAFGLVIQSFNGGTFSLYAPNNSLLLTGPVTSSALTGVAGPPGTGSLFTTTLGAVTGGSLQQYVLPGTVSVSMNLATVNGGSGFATLPGPNNTLILQPFMADGSALIAGDPNPNVPEPTTLTLLFAGAAAVAGYGRRRGR
jgi:hypothetical protein